MIRCPCRPTLTCLVGCLTVVASAQTPESVSMSELPEPTVEVTELLQRAGVQFTVGQRSEETEATASKKDIDAETTYHISYDYRSRTQWRAINSDGNRKVTITVEYSSIELNFEHTVWFRKRPAVDGFWQNKLVLHELDHITISCDPRLLARFTDMLRQSNVIVTELSTDSVINTRLINRLVQERSEQVFSQLNQLVAIRYQELDRVTNHGTKPLPEDAPLSGILRDATPAP